jgi:hypothetical protein
LIASGKHTKNYGKSPFLMGKLTISMTIFNSYGYVSLERAGSEHPMIYRVSPILLVVQDFVTIHSISRKSK